jgi:hypothetical protein
MKNVTLTADEAVIERARERAQQEKSSLNREFRRWLESYAGRDRAVEAYRALMARLDHVKAGGPYSRQELNER